MAVNYIPYTVKGKKTWTQISFEAYGDITHVPDLLDANPSVSISAVLPEGIIIQVPVIEDNTTGAVASDLLPPWKR